MINPKTIIEKYSVGELCQTAEDYFKSISDPTPQMAKPFGSIIESPEQIQNLGLLLSGLHLGMTMTVLDFGAGTCWLSRYLNQLQCQTISCDPSKTALEIGKRLFREHPIIGGYVFQPQFLPFDGLTIDIPDNSVDRIICFDAFHHVPNQEKILSEFARILKNGGIVGFSEPGKYHSRMPQSQYEMKNYQVLENDIDLKDIYALANKVGFTHSSSKLLSNMDVSIDQITEVINGQIDKGLKNNLITHVRNVSTNKAIFFLHKGEYVPDSRSNQGLAHSIVIKKNKYKIKQGETIDILVRIENIGDAIWLDSNIHGIGVVNVGTHLYDHRDRLLSLDFTRHPLPKRVFSKETIDVQLSVQFQEIGVFNLAIDLVSEGVCWFENVGSDPQFMKIIVR